MAKSGIGVSGTRKMSDGPRPQCSARPGNKISSGPRSCSSGLPETTDDRRRCASMPKREIRSFKSGTAQPLIGCPNISLMGWDKAICFHTQNGSRIGSAYREKSSGVFVFGETDCCGVSWVRASAFFKNCLGAPLRKRRD